MSGSLAGEIRHLLAGAVGTVCTAAVCLVARRGKRTIGVGLGDPDPEAEGRSVTTDTPFDLASLTKLFTGAAALRLAAAGNLDLAAAVHHYLPAFRGDGKETVTVRHLLTHTSGLPPGPALHGPNAPSDPRAALLAVPLSCRPGAQVIYSDTGFVVLGLAVEAVTGISLDAAIEQLVCRPLGASSTGYGPRADAAATEWDANANRRIRGRVHDENAAALGGIAGHAGLFGTAGDVLALAAAFADRESGFLPHDLRIAATAEQAVYGTERRGLAWKLRSPAPDAPEHALSPATFGHYGFTGTSVWHDPCRAVTVVLLTNRVYYGRDAEPIRQLRRSLFRLVAAAIPVLQGGNQRAR